MSRMLIVLALFASVEDIKAEQCIPGSFHKKVSSPANADYKECKAWNADTCCTANFTQQLNRTRVRDLYGFHWGHCKNVSKRCEEFLIEEECFYSCEPRLVEWHIGNARLKHVPVCGDYCNEWYEACKDDETCVEDWLDDFDFAKEMYSCPKNSTCRTFKQIYGNGEGLCNKMWGATFLYVNSSCPCTTLDKPIPNDVTNSSNTSACVDSAKFITDTTPIITTSSTSITDNITPTIITTSGSSKVVFFFAFYLLASVAINLF